MDVVNVDIYLEKSSDLRNKFICSFINTKTSYYNENIKIMKEFSDGYCYIGYLWDCLLNPQIVLEYEADQLLKEKQNLYIMWDIHSCERIFIPNYWKFPKLNILSNDIWNEHLKLELPEDIYIFDDTFNWCIVYTHEIDENNNRYCLYVKKE